MTDEHVQSFTVGDVEILRVVEWQSLFVPAPDLVPGCGPEVWKEHRELLAPDHWDPDSDRVMSALQTWVVRSAGRTILVDTGVGNGRERPGFPHFHRRQGDLPGRLERAGVRPQDVDVVVNTHIHADHVGWNTFDVEGEWVPTFPRASYLLPAADDAHFGPAGGYGGGVREDDRLVYEDSVAPVHRAGQAVLWEGSTGSTSTSPWSRPPATPRARPSCGWPRAANGPCSSAICCTTRCRCCGPSAAAASASTPHSRRPSAPGSSNARQRRELVIPAHFAGPGAVEVRRLETGRFAVGR